MKRGFTLVELLAVIVILSVIAIITVPIIGNVIEESKKKALEQSAYGLVEAADYYIINNDGEYSFLFDNNHKGETSNGEKLDYKGTIEGNGKLYIDNNGDVSLCINTDKYYVYKSYNSGIVVGNISEKGECIVKKQGKHYIAYLENEEPERDYYTKEESDERFVLKTELASYATQQSVDTLSSNLNNLSSIVSNLSNNSMALTYNEETDCFGINYNNEWHDVINAGFQQVQSLIPVMTSSNQPSGKITSNFVGATGHETYHFFDSTNAYSNSGDNVPANTEQYIQYEWDTPVLIKSFNAKFGAGYGGNLSTVNYKKNISYSMDGVYFDTLYEDTDSISGKSYPSEFEFELQTPVKAKYIRFKVINISKSWGVYFYNAQCYGTR